MVKVTVHNKRISTKLVKYLNNKTINKLKYYKVNNSKKCVISNFTYSTLVFRIVLVVFLIRIFAAYCNFNYTGKCTCTLL